MNEFLYQPPDVLRAFEKLIPSRWTTKKICRCGKEFVPKRSGHYLCPDCFTMKSVQTVESNNTKTES